MMKKITGIESADALYEYLSDKRCICFGAGRKLDEICRDITWLPKKIIYVLDNNPALENKNREVGDTVLKIYLPKKLKKEDISDVVLIITSSYKTEIIKQLETYDNLKNLPYCETEDFLDPIAWSAKRPPAGFRKNKELQIPKKIHYIWFSNKPIPQKLQQNIDGWGRLCPDYEICCWNEDSYDVTKNPYMYEAYKNGMWSFVTDYARLDIIYEHGGIYLDTDVEMIRRPDELLYNDAFIGFERLSTVNTGSGFGAVRHFPLIKEMRDMYNAIRFEKHDNPNDMVLCPIYETELLVKHGLKLNGNFQIVDDMSVYPVMYFNAKSLYSDKLMITDETISVHHCSWTWAGDRCKLKNSCDIKDGK